ncbi:MAG: hypothetical protein N3A38_01075, partial [Planctomycetota bacterium]|nr:hypothetical protein [Planctomycetota bacterium]
MHAAKIAGACALIQILAFPATAFAGEAPKQEEKKQPPPAKQEPRKADTPEPPKIEPVPEEEKRKLLDGETPEQKKLWA